MEKNIFKTQGHISREDKEATMKQKGFTVWFAGLSGSGKTTIAHALERRLFDEGFHIFSLDGDNLRHGLNKDLLFSIEDRKENIRRAAEVSRLFNDAGMIVISSFISPFQAGRDEARKIIGTDSFCEVYVSSSLEVCEKRDVKGLYEKARKGIIKDFTGIESPFEIPESPDVIINTENTDITESVELIYSFLKYKIKPS